MKRLSLAASRLWVLTCVYLVKPKLFHIVRARLITRRQSQSSVVDFIVFFTSYHRQSCTRLMHLTLSWAKHSSGGIMSLDPPGGRRSTHHTVVSKSPVGKTLKLDHEIQSVKHLSAAAGGRNSSNMLTVVSCSSHRWTGGLTAKERSLKTFL